MHILKHMWSIFRIHIGHTCGIYLLIDTLGAHTFSLPWAHSHLHMLGTGRVHTHTHMRHAYANLCEHTWMHTKHNCIHIHRVYWDAYSDILPWAHTPKDLNKQPPQPWDTFEPIYGTHAQAPHILMGHIPDEEHSVSLRPVSCPSLSRVGTTGTGPHLFGPLSVCSAPLCLKSGFREQWAPGIKWILKVACVIAGSSFKQNLELSPELLTGRWRRR